MKDAVKEIEKFAEWDPATRETGESSNDVSLVDLLIVIGRRKKFLAVSTLAVFADSDRHPSDPQALYGNHSPFFRRSRDRP